MSRRWWSSIGERRLSTGLALTLMVVVSAVLAASAGGAKGKIKIGVIGDQSGPTVSTQLPWLHGFEAYMRKVNEAGGINGTLIDLRKEDEKYNAAVGLAAVKKLILQDRVVALVGLNSSALQIPALPIVSRYKQTTLAGMSLEQETIWPWNPYIFGGMCNYSDQADVAIAYQMALLKNKTPRVATIVLNVPSGQAWAELIKERVTKLGGTYLGNQALEPTAVNADVQIQNLVSQKPDFIALHGSPGTAINTMKSMDKFGMTSTPIIGIFATISETVFAAAPASVTKNFRGVHCYTPSYYTKAPGTADLNATAQKYGYTDYGNINFVIGWVEGMMMEAALKNAGPKINQATLRAGFTKVTNLDTGGLSPNVQFSPTCGNGVRAVRPYHWNFSKKQLVPDGTYDQWKKVLTMGWNEPGTCGKPKK